MAYSAVALVTLATAGVTAYAVTEPSEPAVAAALAPISPDEHQRTIAAMAPPKRKRPLVAVVGLNEGTETSDYIVPYAVLAESGAADVVSLGTDAGPLKLLPALTIKPQATIAAFDAKYPDGADYVILPRLADPDNPQVIAWVKAQAAKGATIVAICAGGLTASAAGLLKDRAATSHWYEVEGLKDDNPGMRWVRDRRYVVDRGVVTTTGVTASLPVSLALIEAFAGRERAAAVAKRFGVSNWDARHRSDAFHLKRKYLLKAAGNSVAFWNREHFGVPVEPGDDEVALAFTADAWARTFRSEALTVADRPGPLLTRHGLTLLPDRVGRDADLEMLDPIPADAGANALPRALAGIAKRYDETTASFIASQLEDHWRGAS
jgi:putative intracellular protease/amidase